MVLSKVHRVFSPAPQRDKTSRNRISDVAPRQPKRAGGFVSHVAFECSWGFRAHEIQQGCRIWTGRMPVPPGHFGAARTRIPPSSKIVLYIIMQPCIFNQIFDIREMREAGRGQAGFRVTRRIRSEWRTWSLAGDWPWRRLCRRAGKPGSTAGNDARRHGGAS